MDHEQRLKDYFKRATADLRPTRQRLDQGEVADVTTKLLREFLSGGEWTSRPLAHERRLDDAQVLGGLLEGRDLGPDVARRLARSYLVLVVSGTAGQDIADWSPLGGIGGSGTMIAPFASEIVVLIPDIDKERTEEALAAAAALAADRAWLGVARKTRDEIPAARREAVKVARLAAAMRRPPGLYRLTDVLVEYAVTTNERVAAALARVARRLATHPELWRTLMTFLDEDCNRTLTAKALRIHRSTLEYRLDRIAKITGHDPARARGVQVLCAAATVHRMSEPQPGSLPA